jgi:hypothetical protein
MNVTSALGECVALELAGATERVGTGFCKMQWQVQGRRAGAGLERIAVRVPPRWYTLPVGPALGGQFATKRRLAALNVLHVRAPLARLPRCHTPLHIRVAFHGMGCVVGWTSLRRAFRHGRGHGPARQWHGMITKQKPRPRTGPCRDRRHALVRLLVIPKANAKPGASMPVRSWVGTKLLDDERFFFSTRREVC